MTASDALPRRGVLLGAAAAGLTACSSPASRTRSPAVPSGTSTAAQPRLPRRVRWMPGPGDLVPDAKLAAVRRIEAMGNDGSHRLRVIDAQYGGLLTASASVLVVCESWVRSGGRIHRDGHTYDVRVVRGRHGWQVTAIHPSRPGPRAHALSAAARQVLRSTRVDLPPAARGDVASGQVHDSVLEAMLALSRRWHLGVSVVRSGHPTYVFGTGRLSDHPRGRAFDTWAIDGHPVVAAGVPAPRVRDYMEACAAAGSYNVGGPVRLGAAPQFFSDATHHDHVHAGFAI